MYPFLLSLEATVLVSPKISSYFSEHLRMAMSEIYSPKNSLILLNSVIFYLYLELVRLGFRHNIHFRDDF